MATYTHGHAEAVLRSHRWRTASNSAGYLLAHLTASDRLLDIGAGPGTITADFAQTVGKVTATEIGPEQLALTRQTCTERKVGNVEFVVANVHALDFPDDSFDVVHAHQVLQHVTDPVQALREMARVTRPGGIVAARDSDYSAFAWWPRLPELDEWLALYLDVSRSNGGEPDAGRKLLGFARRAGVEDVQASSSTWCFATPADRQWWGQMWADRMTNSALGGQLVSNGRATPDDVMRIAAGWREWSEAEDGWFSVLHGEILCRV